MKLHRQCMDFLHLVVSSRLSKESLVINIAHKLESVESRLIYVLMSCVIILP